jgi:hypothetical protein
MGGTDSCVIPVVASAETLAEAAATFVKYAARASQESLRPNIERSDEAYCPCSY